MVLITIGANGRRLYRGPLTWVRLLQSRRPAERPTGGPGSRPRTRQERNAAHAPRRRPPPAPPPPAGHRRRPPRGRDGPRRRGPGRRPGRPEQGHRQGDGGEQV